MKKSALKKYANLIAVAGVNIQKGQEVFIAASLDQPEFVKILVEECYKTGAKKVVVDWSYQPLRKVHTRYRSLKTLSVVENYEEARLQHYVDVLPCRIYLLLYRMAREKSISKIPAFFFRRLRALAADRPCGR